MSGALTFNKHIAPIIFANCAPCHRPGESGPFSLLSYQDVKKRARQIADVTKSRFMPPWPPKPGKVEFVGERRLKDREIERIQRWVEAGTVEGDPADLPPLPRFTSGWRLGRPDLVIELPEPYTLPPEGTDVFRNFVIPLPISTPRYVRAMELRPGNPRVVHHAFIGVDRTRLSRTLDEQDPQPGYGDMEAKGAQVIDGHLFAWTPGKAPFRGHEDMAARLHPESDIILQLHMLPSGKPEPIRPKIGLYFTDREPTRHPFVLLLDATKRIDIPPGETDYTLEESFETPVDIEVLTVYPHAHYLGKEIQGFAILPDGTKKWLVDIPEWDFNWQSDYQLTQPISLPAGSTLTMRWVYDNSAGNVRNPNSPPKRVRLGLRSSDEMGQLILQVLPSNDRDLKRLGEAFFRYVVEFSPNNWEAHFSLANAVLVQERLSEAESAFRDALRLNPKSIDVLNSLGLALARQGKQNEAAEHFVEAIRLKPGLARPYLHLGRLRFDQGDMRQAEQYLRSALKADPRLHEAHNSLGFVLARQGKVHDAAMRFTEAIRLQPDFAEAHYNLSALLAGQGKLQEAMAHYRSAYRIEPDNAISHNRLGSVLWQQGHMAEAVGLFQRSIEIDADYADAHYNLGNVMAHQGNLRAAEDHLRTAIRIRPDYSKARSDLAGVLARQEKWEEAAAHYGHELEISPGDTRALFNLGLLWETAGKFSQAMSYYRQALEAQPDDQPKPLQLEAANKLARILATCPDPNLRDGGEALRLADESARATGYRHYLFLDTLAAAYAETGNFEQAVQWQMKAVELIPEKLRPDFSARLKLYQARKPYRTGSGR